MRRFARGLFVALFFPLTVSAQVINIENARMQTDTTGWKGDAAAGLSLTSNQVRILQADAELHAQYKTNRNLWLVLGHYGFLKGSQTRYIDNALLHLRFNRKITLRLRWEVFTQLQDNSITRIKSRFLAGTGPRLKLSGKPKFHLYLASALMYEHEVENSAPGITHKDWRSSSYLSFTLLPAANTEITATTYYQPLVSSPGDYRILNNARVRLKTGKHLSVRLNWQYLYDRFPANGAPRETYNFSTGIGYEF